MKRIVVLGGGAAGLAAALAAAQRAGGREGIEVLVLERNARAGKKLLATGNGRCNLSNSDISAGKYFSSDPGALAAHLSAIKVAGPEAWLWGLGLYTRADEAGRVYPYSNQAADVLALLERQLGRFGVKVRTGCAAISIGQRRRGYTVQFTNEAGGREALEAAAVICALGGAAGPQFGTDGFGVRFAAACGCKVEPVYPCLVPLRCAAPIKALAGVRVKAAATLLDGERPLAREAGEVQFTDYGLSGICIMQLSCLLKPGTGPKAPAIEIDLFPTMSESELGAYLAVRAGQAAGCAPDDIWLGLLNRQVGRAVWAAAGLEHSDISSLPPSEWARLAHAAKHWRFEQPASCGWKQAQTTGGGVALSEVSAGSFELKGCAGLYLVGETLDCAGSCGGYNLYWAFGSGLVAGRGAAGYVL